MTGTNGSELTRPGGELFDRVVAILEEGRSHVARTVNSAMVMAYWLIGREIVEDEQKGKKRAEYGRALIEDLSRRLTERYGKGFSVPNVRNFRQFYLVYQQRIPEIHYPVGSGSEAGRQKRYPAGSESPKGGKHHPMGVESAKGFHSALGWSQYRALMRVENEEARSFYEQETVRNCWNKRQLERQINTLLFERLLKSRDKAGILQLANEGLKPAHPIDIIKDP